MRKTSFSMLAVALTILLIIISSSFGQVTPISGVLGSWRDINPSAYLSPPANPPLNSIYMLSTTSGWAVGDSKPSTQSNTTTTSTIEVDTKVPTETITESTVSTSTDVSTFATTIFSTSTAFTTSSSTTAISTGMGTIASSKILYWDGSTWILVPAPALQNPVTLKPTAYTLNSVTFGPPNSPISPSDGWAVGCTFDPAAVAIHWDGVSWSIQRAGLIGPDAGCLQSAFMVGSTDTWAVGSNVAGTAGVFWHWTGVPGLGGGWNEPQAPVATVLNSVFMVSPTEGWAVGRCVFVGCPFGESNIYHYYGGSWTVFASPVATPLHSVFMNSPTDGWAVGDAGVILHYASGIWSGPVSPGTTDNTLLSVFMVSGTEGWAVGVQGTILHYTGGTWTKLPINQVPTSPTRFFDFHTVYLLNASNGWAAGTADVILHWDGVNWGTVTSPTLNVLKSVSFGPPLSSVNPNDGWAVGLAGNGTDGGNEPTIIHWNGNMWTRGIAIGTLNGLYSVFMLSTGDVWAVGGGNATTASCTGTNTSPCPVILHFTGGSWDTVTPPPGAYILNSVFMVSPSEGWAVGCQGTMDQCNDTAEASPHPPLTPSGGNIGMGTGIILHYTVTGGVGTWAIFPAPATPPPLPPLNSIFMVNSNEGWAVGDGTDAAPATVLHYTVTGGLGTWNLVTVAGLPLTSQSNLNSVFMLSSNNGWAVGGITQPICVAWTTATGECSPPLYFASGPEIIHWDGAKWSLVATPDLAGGGHPILLSTYFTGPSDGWAVGTPGLLVPSILHWNGAAWMPITLSPALLDSAPPTIPPTLKSVYMTSPSTGWIVGSPVDFSDTTIAGTKPLATILEYAPFGGVLGATSTTTIVSTVSTSTIALTATTVSTITSAVCPPNVTISIKVVDSGGNPVSGATVSVPAQPPCLQSGLQGVTNAQGIVTFTLPPGTYAVKVTRGAYSATQTISITTTGQLFTITLSISPIGQIPGFPPESIAAGIMIGVAMLLLLGRRRRAQTQKASSDVQQLGTDTQTTDSNLQQLGSDTQTADSDLQALGADAQATQSNMTDLGTGMTSVGMAVDDTVGVR